MSDLPESMRPAIGRIRDHLATFKTELNALQAAMEAEKERYEDLLRGLRAELNELETQRDRETYPRGDVDDLLQPLWDAASMPGVETFENGRAFEVTIRLTPAQYASLKGMYQ